MNSSNIFLLIAQFIHIVFQVYIWIVIIRSLLSWFGPLPYHPLINFLRRITDPVFSFIHRYLPFTIYGGIDFAPIVVILALYLLDNFITSALIKLAFGAI